MTGMRSGSGSSRWKLLVGAALVLSCTSSTRAQTVSTPEQWRALFFLNLGLGAEWQRCDGCPGNFSNPLWGPIVKIGAGASNVRFGVDESLIAWWQVLPVTFDTPPNYQSQYLMTEAWYQLEEDESIKLMVGLGPGRHSSSFGEDGRGSAIEAGVDLKLFGAPDFSLRWQSHLVNSLSGHHQAFTQFGLPAGAYRPLLVITTLSLWFW